jgi:surfeit locus 1 family protein
MQTMRMSRGLARGAAVVLLAAVLGVVVTARLGWWQLDRAAQKNALQAALDSRRSMPVLPTADLALDEAAAAPQHHRRVVLAGRWVPQATVYLENRQMAGRAGFLVVTPLLLADGTAVVVQRGWQARNMQDRTAVVVPPTPPGTVTVTGRIAPPPARLYDFGGAASGPIRQNLLLADHARDTRLRLRPLSVLQDDAGSPTPDGLLRQWPPPAADVHKHYGYAFQWFALSALILGLYVWFQLLRPRRLTRRR